MNTAPAHSAVSTGSASSHVAFQPKSDMWVSLRNAPSDYSHDEALLLCETFPGEWVSWVPGYGEITLNRGQFFRMNRLS